jgi:hypothetical protein
MVGLYRPWTGQAWYPCAYGIDMVLPRLSISDSIYTILECVPRKIICVYVCSEVYCVATRPQRDALVAGHVGSLAQPRTRQD